MARVISQKATNAFYSGKNFSLQNTRVENDGERVRLLLWNNCIAYYYIDNPRNVFFSLCGWNTSTTRERLRALGINVTTKRGTAFYNGNEISDFGYIDSGLFA